jgi:hypothetical protein
VSIDFFTQSEIIDDIRRIQELLNTNIFSPVNSRSPFVRCAFIEMLIRLRDLMAKSNKYANRISFNDDVNITSDVKDVTDLIRHVRDTLCHPDSDNPFLPGRNKVSFCVYYGKGVFLKMSTPDGDMILSSDYEDETCFFFGESRIYLKRHIIRAFIEATQQLMPLLSPHQQQTLMI